MKRKEKPTNFLAAHSRYSVLSTFQGRLSFLLLKNLFTESMLHS